MRVGFCGADNCERHVYAKGWCQRHHRQWLRGRLNVSRQEIKPLEPFVPLKVIDFMQYGACRDYTEQPGYDPDNDPFFPEVSNRQGQDSSAYEPALRICRRCPVRKPCLEYALEYAPKADGVWGGTTPTQRRKLAAERVA